MSSFFRFGCLDVSCFRLVKANRKFSQIRLKMGEVLSGKVNAQEIQDNLKAEVAGNSNLRPCLTIVQVGGRQDSNVYINMKKKAAEDIGIRCQHLQLPRTIREPELLQSIDNLNVDQNVHGIIVQMPLDSEDSIDSHKVTNRVDPGKDVDGLCTVNEGKLATGDIKTGFVPCTPAGCLYLIEKSGVKIQGANAVVLGRSKIVGTPMAELLKWHNATVTICHSKTENLPDVIKRADIVVVAIGKPEFVQGSWLKPGAVVIDCGINSLDDSTKKSGYRLVGDVHYESASKISSYITPVPGGVGPMTVALLMHNTVQSAKRNLDKNIG